MMIVETVPYKAVQEAVDCIRADGYNPDELSIGIEEDERSWLIFFLPLDRRWRGGDVEVRIGKDNLDVLEILRGQ